MNFINISSTNITVSKLSFGTASLHHILKESSRCKVLDKAIEIGITHFDTARLYGHGMSEKTLGKYFSKETRKNVTISTKFGISANPLYEKFPIAMYSQKVLNKLYKTSDNYPLRNLSIKECEVNLFKSLKSLQTDWLDIYYLHEPELEDIEQLDDVILWLQNLKQKGVVRSFGLAGNVHKCIEIEKKYPKVFDILQVEDSIENKESLLLQSVQRPIQFTFGYMRRNSVLSPEETFKKALEQNNEGSIIVSSRNEGHLDDYASWMI